MEQETASRVRRKHVILAALLAIVYSAPAVCAHSPPSPTPGGQSPSPNPAAPNTPNSPSNPQSSPNNSAANSSPPTSNSGPIETQILAYEALNNRASAVASFMVQVAHSHSASADKITFIVLDASQQGYAQAYDGFQIQAKMLETQFCAVLKLPIRAPSATAPNLESLSVVATAVSGAAAALTATLALFKETKTVTPSALTLPDEALIAAVVDKLSEIKNIVVFYPTEVPISYNTDIAISPPSDVNSVCNRDDSSDAVYGRLVTLQYLRAQSDLHISLINAEKSSDRVQSTLDTLTAVNKVYDSSVAAWSAVDATTNNTGWNAILRGEGIRHAISDNSYFIELKVQSSGGEVVTLDGVFFLAGAHYFYSGGTIVTAIVFSSKTGQILGSRNFWEMSGDVKRASFSLRANP